MNDSAAIVFFHKGKIPRYLRCTMESARFFNPGSRILLISDQSQDFGALGIEVRQVDTLNHPLLPRFLECYLHISGIKEFYERLFLERWFHLEQLIQEEKLDRVLYLDSDSMLFSSADALFEQIPDLCLSTSRFGGPACTFIRKSIEPFLDFVLKKYSDQTFIEYWKSRSDAAIARGGLDNLGDMVFLATFQEETALGQPYPNDLPTGHIDHCVNIPDGMVYKDIPHRRRQRKRIVWKDDGQTFRPFFRRQADGELVSALAVHFQSGAKRMIRRFNHFGRPPMLPRPLCLSYYNWITG